MLSIYLISNLDGAVVEKVLSRNENCTYKPNSATSDLEIIRFF